MLRTPQAYNEVTVPALKMNEENLPKGGWEQVWHISIKLMERVYEVRMSVYTSVRETAREGESWMSIFISLALKKGFYLFFFGLFLIVFILTFLLR